jgi:hypothetical protein
MLEVLTENHIRMARAFGLRERTITFRYALKLAVIPPSCSSASRRPHDLRRGRSPNRLCPARRRGGSCTDAVITRNYPWSSARDGHHGLLCALHARRRSRCGMARPACPRLSLRSRPAVPRVRGMGRAGLSASSSDPWARSASSGARVLGAISPTSDALPSDPHGAARRFLPPSRRTGSAPTSSAATLLPGFQGRASRSVALVAHQRPSSRAGLA